MTRARRICRAICAAAWLAAAAGCGAIGAGGAGDDGGCTILLIAFQSPRHNEEARFYKERLQQSGWRDLIVVHKDNHSELFWGKYAIVEDGQEDLATAQRYTDQLGSRPFRHARLVALPGKDIGPVAWKLTQAKGAYTVVVGYYYDVPEEDYFGRRRKAVQQCMTLREDEGYEAYYHHGPARSYVTVGTFGPDALQTVRRDNVIRRVVADPDAKRIIREFRSLSDNGNSRVVYVNERIPGTNKARRRRVVERPYLVNIPRRTDDDLTAHHRAGVWQLQ